MRVTQEDLTQLAENNLLEEVFRFLRQAGHYPLEGVEVALLDNGEKQILAIRLEPRPIDEREPEWDIFGYRVS
jgi:hypothetical protein